MPFHPKAGLGKVKAFFLGDPLTGETLPGQVISTLAGDRSLPLDSDVPLLKPEAFIQRPEGAVENVAHGTLKALGEFTTPANIMMLGGIAGAMGVVGKFGLTAVQRLISAGFSADMIHSLTERAPDLKAASEENQDDEFWHIVGEMLPVGAMALGAGAHAARPGAKGVRQAGSKAGREAGAATWSRRSRSETSSPEASGCRTEAAYSSRTAAPPGCRTETSGTQTGSC